MTYKVITITTTSITVTLEEIGESLPAEVFAEVVERMNRQIEEAFWGAPAPVFEGNKLDPKPKSKPFSPSFTECAS